MIYYQFIIHIVVLFCNIFILNSESGTAIWSDDTYECGFEITSMSTKPDPTTAFPYGYYAGAGDNIYQQTPFGGCYKMKCIGPHSSEEGNGCGCSDTPSVTVQYYPSCKISRPDVDVDVDFDLSKAARDKISTCDMIQIEYEETSCDFATNINIYSFTQSSQDWYAFRTVNDRDHGVIDQVFIKSSDDNSWITCSIPNDKNYWLCNNGLALTNPTLPYDIKFINDKGVEVISIASITSFDGYQQFDTGVQFGSDSESIIEILPNSENNGNNIGKKRERRRNEEKCSSRRCCNIRDGLKKSDLPNTLKCKSLSDEECGEFDEFCEWDCNASKYKNKNKRKFKRKFRRISAQKGKYEESNLDENNDDNDDDILGIESYSQCMSEGKLISIDDCGVEYEEEMDVTEREIFCKYHLNNAVSRYGKKPTGNASLDIDDAEKRRLVVLGEDTRTQVLSKSFPYSAVLGDWCTTTMISPRWAVTAAHCVYSRTTGDWNNNYGVLYKNLVGCDDKIESNKYTVTNKYILSSYKENGYTKYDIAWVRLNSEPNVGYFDFGYDDSFNGEETFNIIQYPSDKPSCTKWTIHCKYDEWFSEQMNTHECDTYRGSSGSSIYQYDPSTGIRIIYGIHHGGITNVKNTAARITAGRYQLTCNYIEQDHPGHCDAGRYSEIQSFGGKCLDIHVDDLYVNGGKVQTWDCNNKIQQLWYYDTSTQAIKNEAGKCLDVHYDDYVSNVNRALVQIWDCNEQNNQKWIINENQIESQNGKCLDISSTDFNKKINGGKVMLFDCHRGDNQMWNL